MSQQRRSHVFVVTYGRSGSTVVSNLLNQLPGYVIRGENGNALWPLAESWYRLRDSSPLTDYRRGGKMLGPDHPWYGAESMDVQGYGHALADAFTRTILQPGPDTRVCGFKEIRWAKPPSVLADLLDFVWMFFPRARFVFNTRDYEGLRRSGWWKDMEEAEVRETYDSYNAEMQAYLDAHPERCCHLHYDTWSRDPAAFEPLFRFLGEPWDPELVAGALSRKLTHLK